MRRIIGMLLIGVGAFLLTLSPAVAFWVADEVVVIPADSFDKSTLRAENATYFDSGELRERSGVTVDATITTRGDTHASDDDKVVYDRFISVEDTTNKNQLDAAQLRVTYDRKDAHVISKKVGTDPETQVGDGFAFVWSFDAKKKDTQYLDYKVKKMVPIKFDGEEKVKDLNAYRFVAKIDPTPIARPGGKPGEKIELPNKLLGTGDKGNQPVQLYYANTITIWVDTVTGRTLRQHQNVRQTLRTDDGQDRITASSFDLKLLESDTDKLVGLAKDDASRMRLVRTIVPLSALVLGVVSVGGGIVLVATSGGATGGRRRKIV